MRFHASSCDGGEPEGTVTVGRVPKVPAGDRFAAGIGAIPVTAVPVEVAAVDVVGVEGGIALVDVVVVAVVGLDEHAAVARPRATPAPTRMSRLFRERCRGMTARLVGGTTRLASLTLVAARGGRRADTSENPVGSEEQVQAGLLNG
jgi:hypothetical protein